LPPSIHSSTTYLAWKPSRRPCVLTLISRLKPKNRVIDSLYALYGMQKSPTNPSMDFKMLAPSLLARRSLELDCTVSTLATTKAIFGKSFAIDKMQSTSTCASRKASRRTLHDGSKAVDSLGIPCGQVQIRRQRLYSAPQKAGSAPTSRHSRNCCGCPELSRFVANVHIPQTSPNAEAKP